MSPPAKSFWRRKSFWDWTAWVSGGLAAAVGVGTAVSPADVKVWFAIPCAFCAVMSGGGTLFAKLIDDRNKAEKAAAEKVEKDRERSERDAERQEQRVALEASLEHQTTLTRRAVRRVLEALRDDFSADVEEEEKYKLRASLFRCVGGAGEPRRLTLDTRAGANESSARDWIIEDETPDRCEGIAGLIWALGTTKFVEAGCDWPTDGDPEAKRRYATGLRMTVEQAEGMTVKSVGFGGVVVEVGGRRWGVLLLDTLKRGQFKMKPADGKSTAVHRRAQAEYDAQEARLRRYAKLIGSILLEGVS